MKKIIAVTYLVFCTYIGYTQCNIQSNYKPDGTIVRYLRPEMVAGNEKLEVGLSIQTNGSNYYLATIVRYLSTAYAPGDLTISNDLNQTSVLKLLRAEKTYLNGNDVYLAVYMLSKYDIKKLASSTLKYIMFETSDNTLNALKVSKNKDVIGIQYKCLSLSNSQVINRKRINSRAKSSETVITSPRYMPPEQALKYVLSHKDSIVPPKGNQAPKGMGLEESINLFNNPANKNVNVIPTGNKPTASNPIIENTDGSTSKYDAGYTAGNGESLKEYRERNRKAASQSTIEIIEEVLFVIILLIGLVFLIRFLLRNRSVIRKFFMG